MLCAAACVSSLSLQFGLDTISASSKTRSEAGESKTMSHVVTKSDLVQVAAKAGNLSKAAAGEGVKAGFGAIVAKGAEGQRVPLVGFRPFLPRTRQAPPRPPPLHPTQTTRHATTPP